VSGGGFDALVVGAGPAGSAAARALAQAGARVLVCDARPLPRHRLCGEFVSPEAEADLAALGLDWRTTGARALRAARIVVGGGWAEAPVAGFALERRVLDAWLADAAVAAGAELRLSTSVVACEGDAEQGFAAVLATAGRRESVRARYVVGAFGRQPDALRPRSRRDAVAGRIAFKTHLRGVALPDRVELHAIRGGYVGLAPVGDGRVNVCAVVQARALERPGRDGGTGTLAALVARAPQANAWWERGVEDTSARCAASGLRFGTVTPLWRGMLLCGDAASLPHPLAGDGIAMALRAGRLAAACVGAGLGARLAPVAVGPAYARAWRREFASRLRWDRPLHALLERPRWAAPVVSVLRHWPRGFAALVERTRGESRREWQWEVRA